LEFLSGTMAADPLWMKKVDFYIAIILFLKCLIPDMDS